MIRNRKTGEVINIDDIEVVDAVLLYSDENDTATMVNQVSAGDVLCAVCSLLEPAIRTVTSHNHLTDDAKAVVAAGMLVSTIKVLLGNDELISKEVGELVIRHLAAMFWNMLKVEGGEQN